MASGRNRRARRSLGTRTTRRASTKVMREGREKGKHTGKRIVPKLRPRARIRAAQ